MNRAPRLFLVVFTCALVWLSALAMILNAVLASSLRRAW